MTAIALIPARGGSKRVHRKNVRKLNGHPLIAYTIRAAIDSGVFQKVLVSSDDMETLQVAASYGADCLRRPDEFATDTSPDIEWVKHALQACHNRWGEIVPSGDGFSGTVKLPFDTFSILRPTSPFRLSETIQRAFSYWVEGNGVSREFTSLRAVEKASQHPGKQWVRKGNHLVPLLLQPAQPWHDSQYASLPEVWVQNASLEIAWTQTVELTGTISGPLVMPFETVGHEGFDINDLPDWEMAEMMARNGTRLPEVPSNED